MDPPKSRGPAGRTAVLLKRGLGLLAVLLVSSLLIGSAFVKPEFEGGLSFVPRFPIGEWLRDLPRLLPWVGLFALCSAAMAPLRAFRWGFTLQRPLPRYSDRYHAVALGLLGNNAIPGKLGEGVRAISLTRFVERRGGALPFSRALGSILVCKLLDVFALLLLVVLSSSVPLLAGGQGATGGLWGVAVALPLLSLLLVLVARHAGTAASWLSAQGRFLRLSGFLREVGIGIGGTSPVRLVQGALASLVAIAAVSSGYGFLLHGAGVAAGIGAGAVVLAAVTLGQSPPGVPAGLGMYYLSCSWAARTVGATPAQAAAVAVLSHLTTVITHVCVGAGSLLARKVKLADLLPRTGESVAEAEGEKAPCPFPEQA